MSELDRSQGFNTLEDQTDKISRFDVKFNIGNSAMGAYEGAGIGGMNFTDRKAVAGITFSQQS
jgi:hypothetical protein